MYNEYGELSSIFRVEIRKTAIFVLKEYGNSIFQTEHFLSRSFEHDLDSPAIFVYTQKFTLFIFIVSSMVNCNEIVSKRCFECSIIQ